MPFGGQRRRTRRRTAAVTAAVVSNREKGEEGPEQEPQSEYEVAPDSDKLQKLARLLKSKGVITEDEYSLIFE